MVEMSGKPLPASPAARGERSPPEPESYERGGRLLLPEPALRRPESQTAILRTLCPKCDCWVKGEWEIHDLGSPAHAKVGFHVTNGEGWRPWCKGVGDRAEKWYEAAE